MRKMTLPVIPADLLQEIEREIYIHWSDFIANKKRVFKLGSLSLRQKDDSTFVVSCLSKHYFIENVTEQEARECIDNAKVEFSALAESFPCIKKVIEGASVTFEFCFNDCKAAILMAEEENGVFKSFLKSCK